MQRYFIELSFKGTRYHGWQHQPNAPSVQDEIEKALKVLLEKDVQITGAGRTDTGVHARRYTAHFDSDHALPSRPDDFIYKMNAILPKDIATSAAYPVIDDAHARFSAISRTYKYNINRMKDPLYPDYSWYYPVSLDTELLNRAALEIKNIKDFKSFSKLHSNVNTHYCTIFEAGWITKDDRTVFTIRANRFLRNMVRAIVGTMVDIGRGKTRIEDLRRIIEGRDRRLAGFSVPAQGLILYDIEYLGNIRKPV